MRCRRMLLLSLGWLCWSAGMSIADEPAGQDKPPGAELFDRLDADGDGKLSNEEIPVAKQTLFRRLLSNADKNGDGSLSREEFAAGLESKRPQRGLQEQLPQGAPGGGQGQDPEKLFERLDANHDGKVVADEVPDERRGMFEKMLARADQDGDGALTKQELTDAMKALQPQFSGKPGQMDPAKIFRYLDKNGDGRLTADELPTGRPMLEVVMKRGDADGDGALSEGEFSAAMRAVRKAQTGQPAMPATEGGPQRGKKSNAQRAARHFSKLDADHDGKLSEQEFAAQSKQRFSRLDSNQDGYLELGEMQSAGGKVKKTKPTSNRNASPSENSSSAEETSTQRPAEDK
jgi:Ca2+-binding EF-hand superfamily protein